MSIIPISGANKSRRALSFLMMTTSRFWVEVVRYLIMVMFLIILLSPILWLLISSIRPSESIFNYTNQLSLRTFIPEKITFENYAYVLKSDYLVALKNTVFISICTVILGILVNSAAGYAFAVFNFPFKNFFYVSVLLTFMMPFEAIVIPLYVLIRFFGWTDSYQALIFPAVANGLVIFLFRQFISEIPKELFEAARVDGASWWAIYMKIVMPLSWPAIATAAILLFIRQWESFFWPLVAASSPDYAVIQVAIARHISFDQAYWGRLFASISLATLVPMIIYFSLQRYYLRSIVLSGFK